MDKKRLVQALDDLEGAGLSVPREAYELAQHAEVSGFSDEDAGEVAVYFYDWGIKEARARRSRHSESALRHRQALGDYLH